MNFKTKEEIKNEYWMKFLKTGRIEDYIMYNKFNRNSDSEFAEIGVIDDYSKQEENRRNTHKKL